METPATSQTVIIIKKLIKQGFTIKQLRDHYNEPENIPLNNLINTLMTQYRNTISEPKETPLYKVFKVMRKSSRKTIIAKNLTEAQAQKIVKDDILINPDAEKYMVCYTKQ